MLQHFHLRCLKAKLLSWSRRFSQKSWGSVWSFMVRLKPPDSFCFLTLILTWFLLLLWWIPEFWPRKICSSLDAVVASFVTSWLSCLDLLRWILTCSFLLQKCVLSIEEHWLSQGFSGAPKLQTLTFSRQTYFSVALELNFLETQLVGIKQFIVVEPFTRSTGFTRAKV